MKQIANEYARAMFTLACETGEEASVMAALSRAADVLREHTEYMALLTSPAVPLSARIQAIGECFGGMLPEHVVSLMQLMCEKGRMSLFPDCVEEYRRLLDIKRAVRCARVSSAVPLTEQQRAALIRKLEQTSGGTVTLDCSVDPTLLGGVIVEMDGRVTDGSLRHRMHEIKEVMNG